VTTKLEVRDLKAWFGEQQALKALTWRCPKAP